MKTLIKLASARSPYAFQGMLLFSGKSARAANAEAHAIIENGPWDFVKPTVVSLTQLKMAMALAKEQKWHGGALNGVQMESAMPAEDFLPLPEDIPAFNPIAAHDLSDALGKVVPAMANQDIRYYINGVCFDFAAGAIVATNGEHLHLVKNAFAPVAKDQAIIPHDTIKLIGAKSITAMSFSAEHCRLDHPGGYILGKLIDGKYPDWPRVVPKESDRPHAVAFGAGQIDACKALAKIAKESKAKFPVIKLKENGAAAFDNISLAMFDAFPIEYCLSANYLLDAMIAAEEGTLRVGCAKDSMLVRNGDFSAVVMPYRLIPSKKD